MATPFRLPWHLSLVCRFNNLSVISWIVACTNYHFYSRFLLFLFGHVQVYLVSHSVHILLSPALRHKVTVLWLFKVIERKLYSWIRFMASGSVRYVHVETHFRIEIYIESQTRGLPHIHIICFCTRGTPMRFAYSIGHGCWHCRDIFTRSRR